MDKIDRAVDSILEAAPRRKTRRPRKPTSKLGEAGDSLKDFISKGKVPLTSKMTKSAVKELDDDELIDLADLIEQTKWNKDVKDSIESIAKMVTKELADRGIVGNNVTIQYEKD